MALINAGDLLYIEELEDTIKVSNTHNDKKSKKKKKKKSKNKDHKKSKKRGKKNKEPKIYVLNSNGERATEVNDLYMKSEYLGMRNEFNYNDPLLSSVKKDSSGIWELVIPIIIAGGLKIVSTIIDSKL